MPLTIITFLLRVMVGEEGTMSDECGVVGNNDRAFAKSCLVSRCLPGGRRKKGGGSEEEGAGNGVGV